ARPSEPRGSDRAPCPRACPQTHSASRRRWGEGRRGRRGTSLGPPLPQLGPRGRLEPQLLRRAHEERVEAGPHPPRPPPPPPRPHHLVAGGPPPLVTPPPHQR